MNKELFERGLAIRKAVLGDIQHDGGRRQAGEYDPGRIRDGGR